MHSENLNLAFINIEISAPPQSHFELFDHSRIECLTCTVNRYYNGGVEKAIMIWYFTLTQRRKMIEIFDLPSIFLRLLLAASPLQCCVIYLYSIGEDPRGHEESCLFSRNSTKLHISHAMTLRKKRFLLLAHLLASFGNFVEERPPT